MPARPDSIDGHRPPQYNPDMPGEPQKGSADALAYPDIGATVYRSAVPDGLADELPGLYGSLFATEAWFRIYDETEASGACVLAAPRHVLLFSHRGDTVEVLNKAFPMSAGDAARACRALFRALPQARRIHLEVLFPPAELPLPKRVLVWADDLVAPLPGGAAGYTASLGKRTRKNLRAYENRLRRRHPDAVTTTLPPGPESRALVEQFLAWHLERSRRHKIVSVYTSKPEQRDQLARLVEEAGESQVTTIAGRPAAIEFLFFVGASATVYAGAFDPAYDDVHLGLLSTYWAVRGTAARGARSCHLLWGTAYYKRLLGAEPVTATRLSVFRSQTARLRSPKEAADVVARRLKRSREYYWRSRHVARRALDALTRLARGSTSTGPNRPGAD
jgi:hypothetical protein